MAVVIAELGINHNGNLETLCNMALAAKQAGADYVKIQKRNIEACYSKEELAKPCESPWGNTVADKVYGRELSYEQIEMFAEFCRQKAIRWFASCFDMQSLRWINETFPSLIFNKIPSAKIENDRFVEMVAGFNRPTLISTGLCKSYHQIARIADIFEEHGCSYVLNHCVSLYPCPNERLNLLVIKELQKFRDSKIPSREGGVTWMAPRRYMLGVGYSGHEVGVLPSVIAVQLGAHWIERHFTLDRSWYGADQAASLEPQGLQRLVRDIRELEAIMGDGEKKLYGDEKNPLVSRGEEK